ncbi:MAG: ribonuclease PH [Candidatus Sumerlaeia bacterium]|nr:ribonuclease PH [Candidatus Sumerlaeia bacterium]
MMRIDRREPEDLRKVEIIPGVLKNAHGSCEIRWGNNRILCAASVDSNIPKWLAGKGKGWLTAEYAMLPYSSPQRIPRDITKGTQSSRSVEIQRLIGRSLRSIFNLEALGERTILVDCDVIEADGGTRTACITGGFVAVALAVERLLEEQQLSQKKSYIHDWLAAVSVGIVEGQAVLDLCYLEDSQAETDMNLVMTGAGSFVEIQGTAEGKPFTPEQNQAMISLGSKGIAELIALQKTLIKPGLVGPKSA